MSETRSNKALKKRIEQCTLCAGSLSHEPKPVFSFGANTKILIIGQAPGNKVHQSGKAFDDKSGDTLRTWLGIDRDTFYNTVFFGIVPMGFCFPGKNPKGGDLPPRPVCAPKWHHQIFEQLKDLDLVLLVGQYAQKYYLGKTAKRNLTETVRCYDEYLPTYFPLVHPSPLNFRWHAKNHWFIDRVVPELQEQVRKILNGI
ncbi:uracil-DNA glycosylase family protein [Pareuzebyella sediminis]|uniref:uracil-DNA glycosylase family protein n=1 Tax=Pareuzebyella sediminis TaxID=2607998 RepID=UPI0011F0836F|nr:uracil-DNA glycosylase family protein [Pareuzebyella sediminis]